MQAVDDTNDLTAHQLVSSQPHSTAATGTAATAPKSRLTSSTGQVEQLPAALGHLRFVQAVRSLQTLALPVHDRVDSA